MQDRSVRCWGFDSTVELPHHRLGGLTSLPGGTAAPVMVDGVSNATDLAVGFWHACAVLDGGSARCWGQNQSGELGSCTASGGGCDQITGSALVPGVAGARVVGAGCGSSCAALSSAGLFCWGYDEEDQLGLPSGVVTPAPPTLVDFDFPSTITQIAGGGGDVYEGGGSGFRGHLCAVSSELHCWGANDLGQVSATNVGTTISFPVSPGAIERVTHVALGTQHTCAVYGGGSVTCWGSNGDSRLGMGGGHRHGASDMPIDLPGSARSVAAGESHSCALLDDGAIYCWGSNNYGQLGVSGSSGPTPVHVPLPSP
jgi:alpha-tubulin suppressor-like RCC1 family protein